MIHFHGRIAWLAMVLFVHALAVNVWATEAPVKFQWENWEPSERTLLEEQRDTLKSKGAEVDKITEVEPPTKGGPAVWLILAGAVGISILAETVVRTVKEWKKCGVIIDAQSEELKIRPHCLLGPDYVLVRQANGNVEKIQFENKPVLDLVEMLKALIVGIKG